MKKIISLLALTLVTTLPAHAAEETYHEELLKDAKNYVVRSNHSKGDITALTSKKYTFIYFSAHWCPPCRAFTPKLVKFYNENKKNDDFELLFISSDHNEKAFKDYMKEEKMPWLALKLGSKPATALKEKYKVTAIPTLVLLDEKDNVLSRDNYESALQKYLDLHKK